MASDSGAERSVLAATLVAGAMIAQQIGGKAVRDAFFLSQFDVASLPTMMVVSALVSIAVVRGVMGRPASWLVTRGFPASAALLLGEWALAMVRPDLAAVALYLHIAVFGSVLISGFWSLVTDYFDPHTARQKMGQIATGASAGAVLGGLLVERVGATLSVTAAFPLLAAFHLLCGVLILPLRTPAGRRATASDADAGIREGLQVMKRLPYLRHLASLVFVGAVSAALIDFAFKAEVATSLAQGESMMRFFALYYTAIGITTLIVQSALSRRALEKLGLAGTAATLPASVVVGSVGMLFVPGLWSALAARGAEATFRSSLFRSGYELFYSPVAPRDKRATKTAIDVLWERLGDVAGGVAAKGLLFLGPVVARSAILALAAALGGIALWLCRRLHAGYVEALEARLLDKGQKAAAATAAQSVQVESLLLSVSGGMSTILSKEEFEALRRADVAEDAPTEEPVRDELERAFLDLRSGDRQRIRTVLEREPLDAALVPQVIPLLSEDKLAHAARQALLPSVERIAGQLGDVLTNVDADLVLRRRIPSLLSRGAERSAAVLIAGLGDRKLAVRYRCGRALQRLHSRNVELGLVSKDVFGLVLDEVRRARRVLEGNQQLADPQGTHSEEAARFEKLVRKRAQKRLAHIFHLLALALPRKPLQIAFRGLETGDAHLRGTALEYLDSVLPPDVRTPLWPFLTKEPIQDLPQRPREEIVEDLMKSSIHLKMDGERES